MVELRKRREVPSDVPEPPLKKKSSAIKAKLEPESNAKTGLSTNGVSRKEATKVGDNVDLDGFGDEVETQNGEKTTLKKLVDESKKGVVLFTYPKASTPGCTTQACLFRDNYTPLTATGYSIFGLSTDSPKSNTTFKTKQNLPYTLLCDPKATLISAIGLKKTPKGTTRGVFAVDKTGKVEAAEPGVSYHRINRPNKNNDNNNTNIHTSLQGPAATLEVVRKLVQNGAVLSSENVAKVPSVERDTQDVEAHNIERRGAAVLSKRDTDGVRAEVAAEVADTAQKLDEGAGDFSNKE
ncbi:MAG: hypothetical protein Q9216_003091 [Gyalolechia sp. 2 TL-2023]